MSATPVGFWGLKLLPNKIYSQEPSQEFRITMAALHDPGAKGRSTVYVSVNGQEYVLCSLIAGKVEQQQLDTLFIVDEEVSLLVKGDYPVHLTGNYVSIQGDEMGPPPLEGGDLPPHMALLQPGMDSEEDSEDDDDYDDFEEDSLDDEEISDSDAEEIIVEQYGSSEEDDDEPELLDESRIQEITSDNEVEQKQGDKQEKPVKSTDEKKASKKEAGKKDDKITEAASKKRTADSEDAKQTSKKPKVEKRQKGEVKYLPNGLGIEEIKEGEGATAKKNSKVAVRYIVRAKGKVLDKNVSGDPFRFTLGRGEVIKGWDQGILGMKLGGERRLTVPFSLAYGKKGSPPKIPGKTNLTFDIKLVSLS
ncbi:hypothetical protein BCR43DRAFT_564924 [Syncephalastrum racemosum]|uniref:FK506-binding protein n=1 Tax=Syncephalastrum racemosum TaxID=13706 RepID=A0A1X2H995_SYNRA|nr:hypothetical protein BCR43DRAFT_564924 [Syncephalastrum racemosum]